MDIGIYEDAVKRAGEGKWVEVNFAGGTGRIHVRCADVVGAYRTAVALRSATVTPVAEGDPGYEDYLDEMWKISWEEMHGNLVDAWEGFTDRGEPIELNAENWSRCRTIVPVANAVYAAARSVEAFAEVDEVAEKNSAGASTGRGGGRGSQRRNAQQPSDSSKPARTSEAQPAN